jgi:hypothetical protein
MTDQLSGECLMPHVRALADEIGPRPAGHPAEATARDYIRHALAEHQITDLESIPFSTSDTWGYTAIVPALFALSSNLPGRRSKLRSTLGGMTALLGAYAFWLGSSGQRQLFAPFYNRLRTETLIARIPPTGEKRHTLVLIGHTDSNKHRLTFSPALKKSLRASATAGIVGMIVNGVVQLGAGLGLWQGEKLRRWTTTGLLAGVALLLADELGDYVDGANDNASAVACLLGLGAQLARTPLAHTEVWLAFTGAEEVGCLGIHALLDKHGEDLQDAYFLDFELVGKGQIAYVTEHSGLSHFNGYRPDPASLALAEQTAREHPALGVTGREVVIQEEIASLRGRGYRGLCLVGVDESGWLANWHQYDDHSGNIDPASLETAARFAWAMMQTLDSQA